MQAKSVLFKISLIYISVFAILVLSNAVSVKALGDTDLDGIELSIADYEVFSGVLSSCICEPPFPYCVPLTSIPEMDVDCSGTGSIADITPADIGEIVSLILGLTTPCWTQTIFDNKTSKVKSGQAASVAVFSVDMQTVETDIRHVEVDILLTTGAVPIDGYQFRFEYDTTGLELLDIEPGDQFVEWGGVSYNQIIQGNIATVVGFIGHNSETTQSLQPSLPAAMTTLVFEIKHSNQSSTHDLNFVWTNCADNAIAVASSPGTVLCTFWPSYLAVSNGIFDANGSVITGVDPRYGGVGDGCLGGGANSQPQRAIDFTSGRIIFNTCCSGMVGNADMSVSEIPTVGDITIIIMCLFGWEICPISCYAEADINRSATGTPLRWNLSVADIADLVDHLFGSGEPLADCP